MSRGFALQIDVELISPAKPIVHTGADNVVGDFLVDTDGTRIRSQRDGVRYVAKIEDAGFGFSLGEFPSVVRANDHRNFVRTRRCPGAQAVECLSTHPCIDGKLSTIVQY